MGKRETGKRSNSATRRAERLAGSLVEVARERDELRATLTRIATDPRTRHLVDEGAVAALGAEAAQAVRAVRQRDEMASVVAALAAANLRHEKRAAAMLAALPYRARYLAQRAAEGVSPTDARAFVVTYRGKPIEVEASPANVLAAEDKRPRKLAAELERGVKAYDALRRELGVPRPPKINAHGLTLAAWLAAAAMEPCDEAREAWDQGDDPTDYRADVRPRAVTAPDATAIH